MKRLYLLRHAQALSTSASGDEGRELSPKGHEDSSALGKAIQKKNYIPDYTLCSPAIRTRQTFDNLELAVDHLGFNKDIYSAGFLELLHTVQDLDDRNQSALIVGHNPTIYELAMRLCDENESGQSVIQRLGQGYKPGTLTVFNCPCQVWNDIQIGENMLIDLIDPQDYNAPQTPARWT